MRLDFRLSDADLRFRDEVRTFFREEPPPESSGEHARSDYRRVLAARGWLTMHWPREYGGRGASHMQQLLFKEEANRVGAPVGGPGVNLLGPTLMLHGTQEQQAEFLPRIARDEVQWCQGFSEPGSGSDLASLQTRAVREGDDYVIDGQKIWTSGAHLSDWIFLLVRTDQSAPKHRGISFVLVDMKTPGVDVRPLLQLTGAHGFNEVFLDNVRIPVSNRVGEENRGWYIATTTLDFERSGIERVHIADRDLTHLEQWYRAHRPGVRGGGRYKAQRDAIAEMRIAVEVARLLAYRVAWMQSRGSVPNYEASMAKTFASDLGQSVAQLAANVVGLPALASDNPFPPDSPGFRYLDAVRLTIAQGTGEIQRNIIAQRGLGLPRG